MLPEGWAETTLGTCATFVSGGTPSKANPDYWAGNVPWVTAKDMKGFRLSDTQDHLSDEGIRNGARLVPPGTPLVLIRGMTLHTDVPVSFVTRWAAFNQDVKAVVARAGVDQRFLAHCLAGSRRRLLAAVDAASHGTGRIDTPVLASMPLLLPPLEEQKRISWVADALDDKIELNRRMNETLERIPRAIYREWFGRYEPGALIPPGWSSRPIGDVVSVRGGSTPRTSEPAFWNGEHAFATPKDLASLYSPVLLTTERCITDAGVAQTNSGLLPPGTVLLSSRAPIGYLAISEIPVAVNQGFIAMICDRELPNLYVLRWAQSNLDAIVGAANGTTFLEISKRNFKPLLVLVPPSDLLDSFVGVAKPLHERVVVNVRESRTLAALRDLLLPKLISGEIRLRDAERAVEQAT